MLTFLDDHCNWIAVYFLRKKSETFKKFKEFKAYAEKKFGLKILAVRSDNGGEYLSNEFKQYFLDHGIRHELTVVHSPQQNGGCGNQSIFLGIKFGSQTLDHCPQ